MKRFLLASAALLCGILARGSGFTVAADGSGDFRTVQEAVNAAPDYCKRP